MAKGNMILGYLRGAIGDIVFYRSKGQQQARARNRNPNNPKSNKQMLQRSLLANCIKFYNVVTKGLFKFAFENKKPNESDYNAFVRINIKRGINISKTAFDTEWYGGIGYWRMTEGSLQSIATLISNNKLHFDFGVETTEEVPANATVGWLSSQLINGNPNRYMAGDIITFCGVIFRTPGNGMPSVQPTASNDNFDTSFGTMQFRLNTADTTEVADATGATCHVVKVGNKLCLGLTPSESAAAVFWAQGIQGACLIHSRNTSEGTKVSTQDLATNNNWNTAVEAGKNTYYISAVLADWQASGEAILQGGASTDFENTFSVEYVKEDNTGTLFNKQDKNIFTAPKTLMNEEGAFILFDVICEQYTTAENIRITKGGINIGLTFNVAEPISPTQFNGHMVINSLPSDFAWDAGEYIVHVGNNTFTLIMT